MKKLYSILFFSFTTLFVYAKSEPMGAAADSNEVKKLNFYGYKNRFSNPELTVNYANQAIAMARKIGYVAGEAEGYRIKGIGNFYLNKPDSAIDAYFVARNLFTQINNKIGEANVYNNIGNLYQEANYDKALEYFANAQAIAEAIHNDTLIAKINLNKGNIYYHHNKLQEALTFYNLSYGQFAKLGVKETMILCRQDLGVTYYKMNNYNKAEELLLQALTDARANDMNSSIAEIDSRLFDIYLAQNNFDKAEQALREGEACAKALKNDRDIADYDKSWYQLEFKRKNYKEAVIHLEKLFKKDSVAYNSTLSTNFGLARQEIDYRQREELAKRDKEIASQRFWLLTIMLGLLLVVVGLLMTNVRRKASNNAKLTELNNEVSRQKDNLDRINHHLEEIIDERTRDLQAKNRKLSEYSSYLSHQIRGPIATLKGLMNLEKEGLVDKEECIVMMDKCVSEIDEKIIEMSDMLHDTSTGQDV
jgi:tetratricopeptide (TPR) repeat protein